jgi:hypothetical protein
MSQLTRFRALANPEKRPTITDINEIKHLAMFMKRGGLVPQTRKLVSYMGFNIKGLQAHFGDMATHALVTHTLYPWAICTCGHWESMNKEANQRYKEFERHEAMSRTQVQRSDESE